MTLSRRSFLSGAGALLVAAPAVIRTPGLLMPVKAVEVEPMFSAVAFTPRTLLEWTERGALDYLRHLTRDLHGDMSPLWHGLRIQQTEKSAA